LGRSSGLFIGYEFVVQLAFRGIEAEIQFIFYSRRRRFFLRRRRRKRGRSRWGILSIFIILWMREIGTYPNGC